MDYVNLSVKKKKMLFFKTYLFVTGGKVSDNSTKTINWKK